MYTLFKKSFLYLFLAVGLCCCTQVFSSRGEQGLLSSWGAQASHCSGFFCWGAWALAEKAVAPHSITLAWKIPWTEEPDRLQFMGSLGVGHD